MLILSFDIATEKMYLVVERDDKVLGLVHEYSTKQKYNSALLIPSLLKIFKENNLTPQEIDLIAINNGPGSFTGIRAGAVMARTMAQFLKVPLVGISSLEIYANAHSSGKDKMVLLDARRSKWYVGLYSSLNKEIEVPHLLLKEDVLKRLENLDCDIITEKALEKELNNKNLVFFENLEKDFGLIISKLAKERIRDGNESYEWYHLKPCYLQTPSITMSKKSG